MVIIDLDDYSDDVDIKLIEDLYIEDKQRADLSYQCFNPPVNNQTKYHCNFVRFRPSFTDSFSRNKSKEILKDDEDFDPELLHEKESTNSVNSIKNSPEMMPIAQLHSNVVSRLLTLTDNPINRNETCAHDVKKNRSKRFRTHGNESFSPLATIVEDIGVGNNDSKTNKDKERLSQSYITISTTDSDSDSNYYNERIIRDDSLPCHREYIDSFEYDEFLDMIRSYRRRSETPAISTSVEPSTTADNHPAMLTTSEAVAEVAKEETTDATVPITLGDSIFVIVTILIAVIFIVSAAYLDGVYQSSQTFDSVYIKAGLSRNQTYMESDLNNNNTWISDESYLSKKSLQNSHLYAGCTKENVFVPREGNINRKWSSALFCNERWFSNNVSATYNIPVLEHDAEYLVQLYFNELYYDRANARRFSIVIEEKVVTADFDIYSKAGGEKYSVVIVEHQQVVKDGMLTIVLHQQTSSVKINAISVTFLELCNTALRPYQHTIVPTTAIVNHFTPMDSLFIKNKNKTV